MNEHIQIIINSEGFNNFCEVFMNSPINSKELIINNNKYGLAVKKIQKPDLDFIYNDIDSIMNYFPYPPKIGLDKIEAPLYMNAFLQCLCQIDEFASYFKYNSHVNFVINKYKSEKKNCLSASFKILIENLWPNVARKIDSNKRHFSPNEFWQKLSYMNPSFKNNQSTDLKDLINFIIMSLDEELNQNLIVNNNTIINNSDNNYKSKNDEFNEFYQYYQTKFHSKINELFYAIQMVEIECFYCRFKHINFNVYYFLVFPLEKVKKYANEMRANLNNNNMNNQFFNNNFNNCNNNSFMNLNNNILNMNQNMNLNNINNSFNNNRISNQNNNVISFQNLNNFNQMNNFSQNMNNNKENNSKINNNIITIYDCFEYKQKGEILEGNEQIFCNCCKKISKAFYKCTLETSPKILFLCFDREEGFNSKIKLEYFQLIDLSNYINQKNQYPKYELIGIIPYKDGIVNNGNYIAHCLSPIDRCWYTYDDANIHQINDLKKEVIDLGTPYLLVYKRNE